MKLKSILAIAALSLGAMAANAGTLQATSTANTYKFTGTDDDSFSFVLSGSNAVGSSVIDFLTGGITSVTIDGTSFVNVLGDGSFWSFTGILGAGSHTLSVDATAPGLYKGSLQMTPATAPVPEPETYAMLLAGLGAIGFMSRRRKGIGHS
ncbi:conserved hypothetical protein [Leptothrix cholodnii SP-6]|uniref:Ice-binding protein C-terminal domain-containing protein n=1 Tax=Leptothrix cholodnii (strain ATCC 51168 / LMG 8142 / SP-6) TaxID=395495 RepID=B1Y468_LEPCP|nr:FxDxF family PEP-CTERM protein [Leptothrix cholodnii]ACB34590.1 conserved hypothetical protein [Leptothrix cholodnii SP-6]